MPKRVVWIYYAKCSRNFIYIRTINLNLFASNNQIAEPLGCPALFFRTINIPTVVKYNKLDVPLYLQMESTVLYPVLFSVGRQVCTFMPQRRDTERGQRPPTRFATRFFNPKVVILHNLNTSLIL